MNGKLTKTRLGEGPDRSGTDWKRLDALTDAEIAEAIRNDPDTFEPGEAWLKKAVVPHPAKPKERLTVRFDADLVDWFKKQGRGYQTRMNAVLRAYYEAHRNGRR